MLSFLLIEPASQYLLLMPPPRPLPHVPTARCRLCLSSPQQAEEGQDKVLEIEELPNEHVEGGEGRVRRRVDGDGSAPEGERHARVRPNEQRLAPENIRQKPDRPSPVRRREAGQGWTI